MSWRPVLRGAEADRARALVTTIVAELARREVTEPSLCHGHAGIALLHGQRALAGEPDGEEAAFASIEQALAGIMTQPVPWLYRGYAGIGVALQQLAPVVGEAEEALAQIDELVRHALAAEAWTQPWELLGGLAGLGVYALERDDTAMLARVVHHLAAVARDDGGASTWVNRDPSGEVPDHINLGIAHGVAGVIALLAAICARSDAPDGAVELLHRAVTWLRTHERAGDARPYPMQIGHPVTPPYVLDGWCYGAPSTALVLVRAGQAAHEPAWIDAGHVLARRAARRTDAELAELTIDAALCHGTSSQAHLFHRLGTILDDDELLAAARTWYLRTLDRIAPRDLEPGLQVGLAGAALAMLGGVTEHEPAWSRALLAG